MSEWAQTLPDEEMYGLFRESLGRATVLVAEVHRRLGRRGDCLRAAVLGDLKAALRGDGTRLVSIPTAAGPREFATTWGIFGMILDDFGLDGRDLRVQEIVFEMVRRDLDAALAGGRAGGRGGPPGSSPAEPGEDRG